MLSLELALATLRSRWTALAGTLATLALGVAVIATMALVTVAAAGHPHGAPQRYAGVPEVVQADPYLQVKDRYGSTDSVPLSAQPALPAAALAAYPGAVADRTFYAQLAGGPPDQVGHPWSAAAFTPYRLTAGRPPAGPGQIVVGGGAPGLVGHRVTVLTSGQSGRYLVSGVTASVPFERAVFFSDAQAARLSPRVDALVPRVPARDPADRAGAVRAVPGTRVLTGMARHEADPGYSSDATALSGMESFMGVATLLAGSVALYVMASVFGLSVTQRRRELALLRLTGATSAQVTRMVCGEALLAGLCGSAAGCALGGAGGPVLASWMAGHQLAPAWFRVTAPDALVALPAAFAAGTAVAVAAAVTAAFRAGMTPPVAALRTAAVDDRPPGRGRLLAGACALLAGAVLLGTSAFALPGLAADLKSDVTAVLLVVTGTALLTPALLPPLARLVPLSSWSGMLARQNTLAARRRACAVVTPVLFTAGLAAAILGATATQGAAVAAQRHEQAPPGGFVVVPVRTPGLTAQEIARIRAVPGAVTTAVTDTTVLAYQPSLTPLHLEAPMPIPYPALAVSGTRALRLPVLAGSLAGLDPGTVAVDTSWGVAVGSTLRLWLADGTPRALRVVAVFRAGLGPGIVLDSRAASPGGAGPGDGLATRAYVAPGASLAALGSVARAWGARVVPLARWQAAATSQQDQQNQAGLVVLLAISTCYSAVSIATTVVMSAAARRREWTLLRVTGATRRQVVRFAAVEGLLAAGIGLVLAAAAAALPLLGLGHAFGVLAGGPVLTLPWLPVLAVAAGSLLLAAASAALAAAPRLGTGARA